MDTLLEYKDDAELKPQLNSCKHFLVDYEIEKGRLGVYSFSISSCNNSILTEQLDQLFTEVHCAVKIDLALASVLKNIEDEL